MRGITAREVTHSIAATGECRKALISRLANAGLGELPVPPLSRIHIYEITVKLDGSRKHKRDQGWHSVTTKCLFTACVPLRL